VLDTFWIQVEEGFEGGGGGPPQFLSECCGGQGSLRRRRLCLFISGELGRNEKVPNVCHAIPPKDCSFSLSGPFPLLRDVKHIE